MAKTMQAEACYGAVHAGPGDSMVRVAPANHRTYLAVPREPVRPVVCLARGRHSIAFMGSALLLLFLYGDRPARRRPYQTPLATTMGPPVSVARGGHVMQLTGLCEISGDDVPVYAYV
jgi:hypothetical protein